MSADGNLALPNLSNSRSLTAFEQFELKNLLESVCDSSDDEHGPIGGPDIRWDDFDSDSSDGSADEDNSDFEGTYANDPPLLDFAAIDTAEEVMANAAINDGGADVPEEPTEAIETLRGQRYVGQGKQDKTEWWPSATEHTRTVNLARERSASLPIVTQVFVEKKAAFKTLFDSRMVETIVTETNHRAKRQKSQESPNAR